MDEFFQAARRAKNTRAAARVSFSYMDARRPLEIVRPRAPLVPLARLAVRVLKPGPLRLRMVKFVHDLDRGAAGEGARAA